MTARDERLLGELAALLRDQQGEDAALLDQLCRGALSPAQQTELERRANGDAELSRAVQAYTPLGPTSRAAIVERILRERVAGANARSLGQATAKAPGDEQPSAAAPPLKAAQATPNAAVAAPLTAAELNPSTAQAAPPLPAAGQTALSSSEDLPLAHVVRIESVRRARLRRALSLGAPLLAAAAAALLYLPRASPLPDYELSANVVQLGYRASGDLAPAKTTSALELSASDGVELVLRPATGVDDNVTARAFLERGAEQALLPWPARANVAPSGAIKLELGPPPATVGATRLIVLVGRGERLARDAARLARGDAERGRDFQRWTRALRVFTR